MADAGTTSGGAKERRYVKNIKKVMKKACFQVKTSLFGGDKRDRTADLMTASHALSQLSYTPKWNYYCYEVLKSADCAKKRETFVGA